MKFSWNQVVSSKCSSFIFKLYSKLQLRTPKNEIAIPFNTRSFPQSLSKLLCLVQKQNQINQFDTEMFLNWNQYNLDNLII